VGAADYDYPWIIGRPWIKVKRKWDVFVAPTIWGVLTVMVKIKFSFALKTGYGSKDKIDDKTEIYEIRGVQEIQTTKADLYPYSQVIQKIKQPIVTDLIWLPSVLSVYFADREIYVLSQREELYAWLEVANGQTDSFVMATFFILEPKFIQAAPHRIISIGQQQIKGITFIEFKIMADEPTH